MSLSTVKSAALAAMLALGAVASQAGVTLISENFESGVPGTWSIANIGPSPVTPGWFSGNSGIFSAQAGSAGSYAAADFARTTAISGPIDDYLITPAFSLLGGGTLSFWTRSDAATGFPDMMKVLFSPTGGSAPSDFSVVALTINPGAVDGGYPADWAKFTYSYAGGAGSGRFAFEYLVSDVATAGDYIGVDTVDIVGVAAVAEPASIILVAGAIAGLGATRRRRTIED